jgi:FtsH-binding integral membrane protein
MADRHLPQGTRVQLTFLAVLAGLTTLGAVVLGTLAAAGSDSSPALAFLVTVAPFVIILALMGLAAWLLVRRIRRSPDFRRRQLNGRAQATLSVGFLGAYLVASLVKAVLGIEGWAGVALVVLVGTALFMPVVLLARRFDPRVHWFRRSEPGPDEDEQSGPPRRQRPW